MVPFGSENIRLSIFPTIGKPNYISTTYTENFDSNTANGLVIYGGGWYYKDGAIHCAANEDKTSGNSGSKIIATATNFSDFVYNADVAVNSPGDAGLMFRVTDPAIGPQAYRGYYVGLNPVTGTIKFGKSSNKQWIVIASAIYPVKINDTYWVKVKAVRDSFQVYINGDDKPVIMATDSEYKTGNIGLRTYKALATVDNIAISAL